MIGNSRYDFFKMLCVSVNQSVYCMISLEDGKIRCVALLYGPWKAGRRLIYEEPFRVILPFPQNKKYKDN